jgi:hypothetical protein
MIGVVPFPFYRAHHGGLVSADRACDYCFHSHRYGHSDRPDVFYPTWDDGKVCVRARTSFDGRACWIQSLLFFLTKR